MNRKRKQVVGAAEATQRPADVPPHQVWAPLEAAPEGATTGGAASDFAARRRERKLFLVGPPPPPIPLC